MLWIELQPSYILYVRPFRETSLLVEVFSADHGRVSLIAKGVRGQSRSSKKATRSRFQGLLEPFVPLLISWRGRTNLLNLSHVEAMGTTPQLIGEPLFCAWYLNELLLHTLHHFDAHPALFKAYHIALHRLVDNPQTSLRQFEKSLLHTLGVMPQLDRETNTGHLVEPSQWYIFSPTEGILEDQPHIIAHRFRGDILLAAQAEQWDYKDALSSIKHLFRIMLDHVLAGTKIRSRELFNTAAIKGNIIP